MSVTYLDQIASVSFDATGAGTATLSIPVGSFWIPRFARVTTNIQTSPVAHCTVYDGAVTVTSVGTYVDDTSLGNSDSTSALAGGIAKWGEAITAVFTGGNPGDTGFLNVVGLYTDNLPEALQYLETPGTRFAGHQPTEIITRQAFVSAASPTSVGPGSTVTIGPFDARNFASFYLKVKTATSGSATAFNPCKISLNWFSDLAGSDVVYQDSMTYWNDSPTGAFAFLGGPMEVQDTHHGPYFGVQMQNLAVGDTTNLSYTLNFTSRLLPSPFYRQQSAINNFLVDVSHPLPGSGAGQTLANILPFVYGSMQLLLFNNGANSMNFYLGYAGNGAVFTNSDFIATIPTNGGLRVPNPPIIVPKLSPMITVQGTGGDVFAIRAVAGLDRV